MFGHLGMIPQILTIIYGFRSNSEVLMKFTQNYIVTTSVGFYFLIFLDVAIYKELPVP